MRASLFCSIFTIGIFSLNCAYAVENLSTNNNNSNSPPKYKPRSEQKERPDYTIHVYPKTDEPNQLDQRLALTRGETLTNKKESAPPPVSSENTGGIGNVGGLGTVGTTSR